MSRIERVNLSRLPVCEQVWEEMTPTEGGRICQKCRYTLIDFRGWSQREIAETHLFTEGKVCGVYDPKQIEATKPRRTKRVNALFVGIFGALAYTSTAQTTEPVPTEQTEPNYNQAAPAPTDAATPTNERYTVAGRVKAPQGEEVVFGNVYIEGTQYGVTTTEDGFYSLDLTDHLIVHDSLVLVFDYAGFETKRLPLHRDDFVVDRRILNVQFQNDQQSITSNFRALSKPPPKSFWQRVKNFFKRNP